MVEPHEGATYQQQVDAANAARDLGYSGFFRSDHYLAGGPNGRPGPTDAWATLAAMSLEVQDIQLGTLVSPVTFRAPGVLAVLAAQVDRMSRGRVEVGLGAGWNRDEHRAMGLPFPPLANRMGMLLEYTRIVREVLHNSAGEPYSFDGAHYAMDGNPCLPRPVQHQLPIIVGGNGKQTRQVAAAYATEYNAAFLTSKDVRLAFDHVQRLADVFRRRVVRSAAVTLCISRTDEGVLACADHLQRPIDELRARSPLVGTPQQVVDQLGQWEEATGADRLYVQLLDITQLGMLELLSDAMTYG